MAIGQDAVVNCQLFPAQRQDCKSFESVCQSWPWASITHVVADKGYDTTDVRKVIQKQGAQPVIPRRGFDVWADSDPSPADVFDRKTYQRRHLIERLFGRIKENKRIATRFDKLDAIFLSFIALALLKAYKLF